jgi:hypothetical protein
MFDVFIAEIKCPKCSSVIEKAEIQTHIRGGCADSSGLHIGFAIDAHNLTEHNLLGAGYILINKPEADKAIKLLDTWICPVCQTEQWACVTITDYKVHAIEGIKLDKTALISSHFISDINASLAASSLLNGQCVGDQESIEILLNWLP